MQVPMMEKAYAKLFGSYTSLSGGWTRDSLVDLTGGVAGFIEIKPECAHDDKLWQTLIGHAECEHVLLGCSATGGRESEMENSGLYSGHAYAVLNCKEVDGFKLIQCRNPWGSNEWKGAWADGSKEWTQHPHVKSALNEKFSDDGAFWMSYKDFCKEWTMLDVVKLYPKEEGWNCQMQASEWKGKTAGGPLNHNIHRSSANPQFSLYLEEDSKVVFSVMQKDTRYVQSKLKEDADMTFFVIKADDSHYNHENPDDLPRVNHFEPSSNICSPMWTWGREVSGAKTLQKGAYVIVPCTMNPGVETQFFLRVFSKANFKLAHMKPQ
jgi:calpain